MEAPITIVNLIHCRLTPTRPFSKRSPTHDLPTFNENYYSVRKHLIRWNQENSTEILQK
ncbi:MAG: hypothetical protein LBK82_03275 [Planctomycetaceae bacterium]|nr:hypothetical protein [Planctomycetaceae bacterium]